MRKVAKKSQDPVFDLAFEDPRTFRVPAGSELHGLVDPPICGQRFRLTPLVLRI
jgi:hypothetical protein